VLAEAPHIVFPGNLQGRSVRETGPKGATLVTVESGAVVAVEHRSLDVIRWAVETLDLSAIERREDLLGAVRTQIERAYDAAEGRGLAVRVRLVGATALHADLVTGAAELREEIETLTASVAPEIWLEKLEIQTGPRSGESAVLDPTVAGTLAATIDALAGESWLEDRLAARLAEIRAKLPAGARADELLARLAREGAGRARRLALALLEKGQG
jgi:hypothetical protein